MLKPDSQLAHRVRVLIKDRAPENRLLALMQVEATLSLWPDALIDGLLGPAAKDDVSEVARRAGAVLDRHRLERLVKPGRRRGRPILGSVTSADLARVPELASADLEAVRSWVLARLKPHLERLCARIEEEGAGASPKDVSAIGALGWPGALPVLKRLARHPELQVACVQAFERVGDRAAQDAICVVARSPAPAGRGAALEALGGCAAADAVPLLATALKGESVERIVALRGLAALGVAKGWPLILSALADEEPMVAVAAVRALGQIADETFGGPLVVAASHADERVRATVASALGRVVTNEARDTVLALCKDPAPRVAANAVEASLSYHTDHGQARKLYFELLRSTDVRVRGNATVLLWTFNSEAAARALNVLLRSPRGTERATGYWCAARVAAPEAVRNLVEAALPEDDPKALERALDAFDALDRPDLLAPVRRGLTAPLARMRIRAATVLARVGRQSELGLLLQALRAETDPKVKSAILRVVAQLSPEEALARLPSPTEPEADRTIANVVDGLGEAGQVAAMPYLVPMLDARAARIRGSAVVALASLGHLEALDRLEDLLERAPATGRWVLTEMGRRLTPQGLEANPVLARALADRVA
jgi:HEAT repeat protein